MEKIGNTLAVGYILDYLKGSKTPDDPETKDLNTEVLSRMSHRFASVTFRQFMLDRKPGGMKDKYYPSSATKCARRNWRDFMGIPAEELDPEVVMKFWYGDLLELGCYGLLDLAYVGTKHSIGFSNDEIMVPFGSGAYQGKHRGRPDGLVYFDYRDHYDRYGVDLKPKWLKSDGEYLVLEFKSMGDYPFRKFCEDGPDDTWGYLGQIHKMMEGLETPRYIYVAINREKGGIAEYVGSFQKVYKEKADRIYNIVMEHVEMGKPPAIPNQDGYGTTKTGADGWSELALNCSFCGHKKGCFGDQGFAMREREVKTRYGTKTVYDVKGQCGQQLELSGMVHEIVGGVKVPI